MWQVRNVQRGADGGYLRNSNGTVAVFRQPTRSVADFRFEATRLKAAGFNAVWIDDFAWSDLSQADGMTLNEPEVSALLELFEIARQQGLRILFKLNAAGNGFFPSGALGDIARAGSGADAGYDFCTWFSHPGAYDRFLTFSQRLLARLQLYFGQTYFLIYSEPGGDDRGQRCAINAAAYQVIVPSMRAAFGSYPAQLATRDAALRNSVAIGWHDDGYINDAFTTDSPIAPGVQFDFVSGHNYWNEPTGFGPYPTYLEQYSATELTALLDRRRARFAAKAPGVPYVMSEWGVARCRAGVPVSDAVRASVFTTVANWALTHSVGWNYWGWTSYLDSDTCGSAADNGNHWGLTGSPVEDPVSLDGRWATPLLSTANQVLAPTFGQQPSHQLRSFHVRPTTSAQGVTSYLVRCDYGVRAGCLTATIGGTTCALADPVNVWASNDVGSPLYSFAYFSCPPAPAGTAIRCATTTAMISGSADPLCAPGALPVTVGFAQ